MGRMDGNVGLMQNAPHGVGEASDVAGRPLCLASPDDVTITGIAITIDNGGTV